MVDYHIIKVTHSLLYLGLRVESSGKETMNKRYLVNYTFQELLLIIESLSYMRQHWIMEKEPDRASAFDDLLEELVGGSFTIVDDNATCD